jgi:tetratricopeptide (TPR) repeat protein
MEMDKDKLIEAYFAETLSADQKRQLEWLMEHDTEFAETFNFEKETRDTIVYNERNKLKERFQVLEKQSKPVRKLMPWYIAASILIVFVTAWVIFSKEPSVDPKKLYAEYMEPYPNVVTPKVRGELSVDKMMSEALALYDKQAYTEASVLLEQVYNEHPNDQTAFYLAICQLMLKKPGEAIALLEAGEWQDTTTPTSTVVNWYLGLAFLQQGEQEAALPYFELVAASNVGLSEPAREVVEELKNMKDTK